jgi:hypothetical protein
MMPNLTRYLRVHTWDLALAVGADDRELEDGMNHTRLNVDTAY